MNAHTWSLVLWAGVVLVIAGTVVRRRLWSADARVLRPLGATAPTDATAPADPGSPEPAASESADAPALVVPGLARRAAVRDLSEYVLTLVVVWLFLGGGVGWVAAPVPPALLALIVVAVVVRIVAQRGLETLRAAGAEVPSPPAQRAAFRVSRTVMRLWRWFDPRSSPAHHQD